MTKIAAGGEIMTDVSAVNMAYALPIILGSGVVSAIVAGAFMLIGKRMDHKAEIEKKKQDSANKKDFDQEAFLEDLMDFVKKLHSGLSVFLNDRIKYLCLRYIGEKSITGEELEDLLELYRSYQEDLDGNGTVETFIAQAKVLPIVVSKISKTTANTEYHVEKDKDTKTDKKPVILAVDDSEFWLAQIKKALGDSKYTIYTTTDPTDVRAMLWQASPQLIILDNLMNDLTGLELVEVIKERREFKNTPIIMLTADDTGETLSKISELGINEMLSKPFKASDLRAAVSHYLN